MKKEYMKPSMKVIELQHLTQLLQSSVTGLISSGLGVEDELDISDLGGGSSIWDR